LEEKTTVEENIDTDGIIELQSHLNIYHSLDYNLLKLDKKYATLEVSSDRYKKVDSSEYIWSGDIVEGAMLASQLVVNEKDFFIISLSLDLLNPIKESAKIVYDAMIEIDTPIKKIVKVDAKINDILFFQGRVSLVKLDESKTIDIIKDKE